MEEIENHLVEHGIRPTAVRLLVWKEAELHHGAFSLMDMENRMPHMDRSSIFRALKLFAEHHLLHEIDDGSGSQKYCVCRCEGDTHVSHVHFTCTRCGTTICLDDIEIPHVNLPNDLVVHEIEYVVKGVCAKCSRLHSLRSPRS